ncbi:hypothetical protein BGZ51_008727 [Haplosporangium sp. Z 767]|nr:hypothetical protein BGZ51_008727 [Haplosporangium sp. Z 767]
MTEDPQAIWLEQYRLTQAQEKNLKDLMHQRGATGVTYVRDRLREEYERLILSDIVLAQSKEIESALWKNVFYIVIDGYRRKLATLPRPDNSNDQAEGRRGGGRGDKDGGRSRPHGTRGNKKQAPSIEFRKVSTKFRAFLQEATGYYHRLIQSLTTCYDLNESGTSLQSGLIGGKDQTKETEKGEFLAYFKSGCDLARYRQTYSDTPKKNWSTARDYYNEARNLLPSSGNPYNQLAVIATFMPNNFLVLYYYYRSLAVRIPFMTARNNIKLLIQKMSADPEKASKFIREERYNDRHAASSKDSSQLNNFLSKFVLLHGALFLRNVDKFNGDLMGEDMERLILDRQIDPDLLLKIQIVNMSSLYTMCYIPLQDDGSTVSPEYQLESERQALQLILNTFATILRYSTSDLENHRNGEHKNNGRPADFLPSNVHRSMAVLRLSLKWLHVNIHHVKRLTDGLSEQEKERFRLEEIWEDLAVLLTLLAQVHPYSEDSIFCRDVLKEDAELQGFAALKRAIDERPLSIIPPSRISPKAEMQMRIADMFQDALALSKVEWLDFYAETVATEDGRQTLEFFSEREVADETTMNAILPTPDESFEGEVEDHAGEEEEDEETDYERDAGDEDMNPFHKRKTLPLNKQRVFSAAPAPTLADQQQGDDAPLDQDVDQRQAVAALLSDDDNDLSLIVGRDDDDDDEEEEVVLFKGRSNTLGGRPTPKPAHLKMSNGVIGAGRRASMSPPGSNHSSPGLDVNGPSRFSAIETPSPTVDSLFGGFQFGVADDWRDSISSVRTSRTSTNSNTWGGLSSNALGNGMISPTSFDANTLGGFSSIPARGSSGVSSPSGPLSAGPSSFLEEEEEPLYYQHRRPLHVAQARPMYRYQAQAQQQQTGFVHRDRNGTAFSMMDGDWR